LLPLITEDIKESMMAEILPDVVNWRKKMIHYIKEENPEVNTIIIEAAQQTNLDPKAIALGAYLTYILLEKADKAESSVIENLLD
jgi:hypothetical protein